MRACVGSTPLRDGKPLALGGAAGGIRAAGRRPAVGWASVAGSFGPVPNTSESEKVEDGCAVTQDLAVFRFGYTEPNQANAHINRR